MRALVSLSMFCSASAPLMGQAPAELAEGARVRVRSVSTTGKLDRGIEGTLERRSGDTVWVRPTKGGELTAYSPSARQLFVYSGRASSAGRGALLGGGFGALAGAAIGFAAGRDCDGDEWLCFDRGTTALLGGAGLGLTGLVGGLIVGALSSHEVWRRAIPSRITPIALGAPNGVTFGLAVRF